MSNPPTPGPSPTTLTAANKDMLCFREELFSVARRTITRSHTPAYRGYAYDDYRLRGRMTCMIASFRELQLSATR